MTFDIAEVEAIDQGIYPAVVTKIELKKIENGEYAGNTIRIWHFTIDVNGTSQEVTSSSSMNTGPKSKAYLWLTAILNRHPKPGEKGLSPIGLPCRVHLIVDPDSGYNKVAAVLPAEPGQKPVTTPSATFEDGTPVPEEPTIGPDGLPY